MPIPAEDDFVQIKYSAPHEYHPSKFGVVVSVAKCAAQKTASTTGIPIGDLVIWVGVDLGDRVEAKVVPLKWLEVVEEFP